MAETKLLTLREKIAEMVDLDPGSVDNDEAVAGALEDFCSDIEGRIEAKAHEYANAPERMAALKAEVERGVDMERAAEEILARADERRKARTEKAAQALDRDGRVNVDEAARHKDEIIARANQAQTKALSGAMSLALTGKQDINALLRRPVSADDPIKLLQRAHDDMLLVRDACGVGADNEKYPSLQALSIYPKWHETFSALGKAFDTSDASAWTPTYYSADLIENVYQTTDVAGLFPRFPWPGPGGTATVPVEGDDIDMFAAGEATTDDDDPKFTADAPGVGTSITVTARAFAARTVWSYEMEEDSIIPILEHVRRKFVRCFARNFDMALLDGDADGTHQDTGRSLAANDVRRLFDGLRNKALADSPLSGATYFNAEQVMTPLLNMGAYGQPSTSAELPANGTVGICSHATKLLLGFLRDTKDERVGGSSSPLTAGVSGLMGYPIVGSAMVVNDLNATGVYDGSTTTNTYLLWVYAPAWHIYDKAQLTMQVIDRPEQGQRVMVGRNRLAFQHMYPSASTTTRMLYAFADTAFPS